MKPSMSNYRIFTSEEFLVLAAFAGLESVRLLSVPERVSLEEEKLRRTLFALFQKNLIDWEEGRGYGLMPDMQRLFSQIGEAERELHILSDGGKRKKVCFLADEVVVTEVSRNDLSALKVCTAALDVLPAMLEEETVLPAIDSGSKTILPVTEPEGTANEPLKDEEVPEQLRDHLMKLLSSGRVLTDEADHLFDTECFVYSLLAVYDRKKSEYVSGFCILSGQEKPLILSCRQEKTECAVYTRAGLQTLLDLSGKASRITKRGVELDIS